MLPQKGENMFELLRLTADYHEIRDHKLHADRMVRNKLI